MNSNKFLAAFEQIRNNFALNAETLRYIDRQTVKIANNPIKSIHYLEKIRKYLHSIPEAADLLLPIISFIQESSKSNSNTVKFNFLYDLIQKANQDLSIVFIRAFSLFLSNLITPSLFIEIIISLLQSVNQNSQSIISSLKEIIQHIHENPIAFIVSLTEKDLQKISIIYNPSFDVSPSFQYLVLCNFFLQEKEMKSVLNALWLYSFSIIPFTSAKSIIAGVDSKLVDIFQTIHQMTKPIEFHPSHVSKYKQYFIYPAAEKYITKELIYYLATDSKENKSESLLYLESMSRFPVTSTVKFFDNFCSVDNKASRYYRLYLRAVAFAQTGDEFDLNPLLNECNIIFGNKINAGIASNPQFCTLLLEKLRAAAEKYQLSANSLLINQLASTNISDPNYRFLMRKLYRKSFVMRTLITGKTKVINVLNYDASVLGPVRDILSHFEAEQRVVSLLNFLSKNQTVIVPLNFCVALFYLSVLYTNINSMNEFEKQKNIMEIIGHTEPPYTSFHGELSCIDIILRNLIKSIYKCDLNFDITKSTYLYGSILFKIVINGDYITISPFINAFLDPKKIK